MSAGVCQSGEHVAGSGRTAWKSPVTEVRAADELPKKNDNEGSHDSGCRCQCLPPPRGVHWPGADATGDPAAVLCGHGRHLGGGPVAYGGP